MVIWKLSKAKQVQETMNKIYRKERITNEEFIQFHEYLSDAKKNLLELEDLAPTVTEECGGEAHSNAYIDNCGRCAPLWGKVLKTQITNEMEKE